MNRQILVFDDGDGAELNLQGFVDSLDAGARMYAMGERVCFLTTALDAFEISDRFIKYAGSRLFFVADITGSPGAGRMFGSFWDFMKSPSLPNAAE
ncbi:MAG: hypothetical protein JO288_04575 [Hyphomicrobiales bacterium]|nr:hypothetical protein [Hyphomicrobiales bacterium]